MQLVERHIINQGYPFFKAIDAVSFLSKNLYNKANYIVRQEFINTSKEKEKGNIKNANWITYQRLQKQLQNSKDVDYRSLPAKVSQHVLKSLDKNWKSFFASIRDWKKNPSKYTGRPKLPKYKDKTKGRGVLCYTIQAISRVELRKGIILLSGTKIRIQTKQNPENIKQVRIVPKTGLS